MSRGFRSGTHFGASRFLASNRPSSSQSVWSSSGTHTGPNADAFFALSPNSRQKSKSVSKKSTGTLSPIAYSGERPSITAGFARRRSTS